MINILKGTVTLTGFALSCQAIIVPTRRAFLAQSSSGATAHFISSNIVTSPSTIDSSPFQIMKSELDAKDVSWNCDSTVDWKELRYGSSTLKGSRVPPASPSPTYFPPWMAGTWIASYRFSKATFPQGKKKLDLRVPGAGLGTCLALPNIGYNPSPFVCRYLPSTNKKESYEDAGYNVPRRFEAFWPESKVTSVQIEKNSAGLTPKCFVTGEGCSAVENASLHSPSTRLSMDFSGPTRSGGYLSQTIDVTMVSEDCSRTDQNEFIASRQYAQFNINQNLQTFYKEIVYLIRSDSKKEVNGRVRVAAFLPITDADLTSYDDASAIATYDYEISLKSIPEEEASQI